MRTEQKWNYLDVALFICGVLFVVFHIAPAFLNLEIRDRLMVAGLFDMLTPLVIIGLVLWIIFGIRSMNGGRQTPGVKWLLFLGWYFS